MPAIFQPVPLQTPLVDPKTGLVSNVWALWFQQVAQSLGGAGAVTGSRAGNVALASLLTTLAVNGEIIDSTTP